MDLKEVYKKELLNSIPVVSAMEIDIKNVSDNSITITAPLNTNINYEGTAFGGSLNTACVLSCYLLVHHFLRKSDIKFTSLVIQNSSINYIKPVKFDFMATSKIYQKDGLFLTKLLAKKKVGRVKVRASINCPNSNDTLVDFQARFVVTV